MSLYFWFLALKSHRNRKTENDITVIHPQRADQYCSVAYTKGHLPLIYDQDLKPFTQKIFSTFEHNPYKELQAHCDRSAV